MRKLLYLILLIPFNTFSQAPGENFEVKLIKDGNVAAMTAQLYQPEEFKNTHMIKMTQKDAFMGLIQTVESHNLFLIRVWIEYLQHEQLFVVHKKSFESAGISDGETVWVYENEDLQLYMTGKELYVVKASFAHDGQHEYFYIPLYAQAIPKWKMEFGTP